VPILIAPEIGLASNLIDLTIQPKKGKRQGKLIILPFFGLITGQDSLPLFFVKGGFVLLLNSLFIRSIMFVVRNGIH
jgi:hypothetical protein